MSKRKGRKCSDCKWHGGGWCFVYGWDDESVLENMVEVVDEDAIDCLVYEMEVGEAV